MLKSVTLLLLLLLLQPADDLQQNADVALMQSQRLERSEQPATEEQNRSDIVA